MPTEITMPQLSDTMTEGTLVKWLKKEGDKVKAGEIIAEVETDKATMEMESFEGGTIAVIVAKEGDKVGVGNPIAVLATGKESIEDVKKSVGSGAGAKKPASPAKSTEEETAKGDHKSSVTQAAAKGGAKSGAGATATANVKAASGSEHDSGNGSGGRIFASPLARRIAADKGVDLAT
ncbi:MAG TPA: E3 binding domain-containing protein, partial [Tepidisphaeraceae bacterium]|nr:E3 binding domain-containing protein [Tepidisphaeraceae bacterium]